MCSVCGLSSSDHPQRATHGAPHLRRPALRTWHTGPDLLRLLISFQYSVIRAQRQPLKTMCPLLCYSPVAALTPVLSQSQRETRPAALCIADAHQGQV